MFGRYGMQRWNRLIFSGLVLGSLGWASSASAYSTCTKTPTKADQEAAEGAFKAGFGSYQEGDYPKAIMYWEDAYRRDCTAHLLLLNLANAFERIPDKEKAVEALKAYLEFAGDVPNRAQLERRVENLEAQIASEKATAAPPTPEPTPVTEPAPAQPDDTPSSGKSIAPWIVVGASGAVTIVGVLVYLGGAKKVSDSEEICPDRRCPNSPEGQAAKADGDDGRSQMTVGGIVTGVGLVGVAGGLVWHFLEKPSTDAASLEPRRTLQPTFTTDYAGLTLGGTF